MPFTEFFCQGTGNNLNSGSTNRDTPDYTSTNGNWNSGTGVFIPTSGDPRNFVSVGDFASVYLDAATTAVYIALVTAVTSTSITVSTTVKSGTAPTTGATGISMRVGGAWSGPSEANGWPLNTITGLLKNTAGYTPRINFKNDVIYRISAQISVVTTTAADLMIQGYTNNIGDKGKAIFDGGTTGPSYILFLLGPGIKFIDCIFQNNGSTGGFHGVQGVGNKILMLRCVFRNFRGDGYQHGGNGMVESCEFYNNNLSNHPLNSGFRGGNVAIVLNCVMFNNYNGMNGTCTNGYFSNCIIYKNQNCGFLLTGQQTLIVLNQCDFYSNIGDAMKLISSGNADSSIYLDKCNYYNHPGYAGIGSGQSQGFFTRTNYCGYGLNASGNLDRFDELSLAEEFNNIYYNEMVWADPENGDFRLTNQTFAGIAIDRFAQTNTIGYQDIGAAQYLNPDESPRLRPHVTTIKPSLTTFNDRSSINGINR